MNEFGIFNDEGCVQSGYFSHEEAEAALQKEYPGEDGEGLYVAECCHDHPEFEKDACEECDEEGDDEDEDEEDDD